MARNAPCAEAARQRVRTECVHHRSTFASMRNTDSESDAESVAVDESADSGREAALKHARRCWLSTGTKVATTDWYYIISVAS